MFIQTQDQKMISLSHFEGPLSFLLHLAQKSEIDLSTVSVQEVIVQYLNSLEEKDLDVDDGAEFIGTAASLLWLKSKSLLPLSEQEGHLPVTEEESPFKILPQLVEYLQFKEISKDLAIKELHQNQFFVRGTFNHEETPLKKFSGLEHLSVQQFAVIFQDVLKKAHSQRGFIHEEIWRVADKMIQIRGLLAEHSSLTLSVLFSSEACREELIVTFLSLLELMKIGELGIGQEAETGNIWVFKK